VDYVIVFTKNSKKDFDGLDNLVKKRIAKKLEYLRNDPIGLSKGLINFKTRRISI
jgi:hypothetical protein